MTPVAIGDTQGTLQARKMCKTAKNCLPSISRVHKCRQERGSNTDGERSQLKVQSKLWDQNWKNAETPEHVPLDSQSGNACTNTDVKCLCVFRSVGNWLMTKLENKITDPLSLEFTGKFKLKVKSVISQNK